MYELLGSSLPKTLLQRHVLSSVMPFYEVIVSSNVSYSGVGVQEGQVETKTFDPMSYGNEAFNLHPRCVAGDNKLSLDIHLYPEIICMGGISKGLVGSEPSHRPGITRTWSPCRVN